MCVSSLPQVASRGEGLLVVYGDQQTLSPFANREAGRILKNMHIV